MRFPRLRSSRTALLPIVLLIAAMIFWPSLDRVSHNTSSAQGVSWLSSDSTSYLTSSGIPVMVPSWLPGPVAGTTPEIYAGGGNYTIYFYAGSSFLYITGVAGGGFPGGSEANLNVELSINSSVLGYPAIHDLGIPEGSDTPIYDKVMWIADGVFYTVYGNGLDTDAVTLANGSAVLYPQAAPEPTAPPVSEPVQTDPGVVNESTQPSGTNSSTSSNTSQDTSGNQSSSTTTSTTSTQGDSTTQSNSVAEPATGDTPAGTGPGDDGTGGPWYTGSGVEEGPSDGTSGATPPFLGDDGTGGAP